MVRKNEWTGQEILAIINGLCNYKFYLRAAQFERWMLSDCSIKSSDDGSGKHVEDGDANQNP